MRMHSSAEFRGVHHVAEESSTVHLVKALSLVRGRELLLERVCQPIKIHSLTLPFEVRRLLVTNLEVLQQPQL